MIKKLLVIAVLLFAHQANAEVKITEITLQKGAFNVTGCDDSSQCVCEADIKYPALSGFIDEAKQNNLNNTFKKVAEQAKCQGEPAPDSARNENNFSIQHHYEITYQSPTLLAFKFSDWSFEGGAHGNGTLEGSIIDLVTGKPVSFKDLFADKDLPEINESIYKALLPEAEGIFRDEVESRKASFIKDGVCTGCTAILDKNGLNIVFQTYEVAPFSVGNPSITIPAKFINYPAVREAVTTQIPAPVTATENK